MLMKISIPTRIKLTELKILTRHFCRSSCLYQDQITQEPGKSPKPPKDPVKFICEILATRPWTKKAETQLNLAATNLTTHMVIDILSNAKTSLQAYRFFKHSQTVLGFKHDIQTYFKILEILGRARNLNIAKTLLLGMPENGVPWEDCVFNSLIRSYGRQGNIEVSVKFFKMMKEVGVRPTVLTFNNLFTILLKRGRTNMVEKHYAVMVSEGILPDVYTYNILIRGFCMASKIDRAVGFFRDMKSRKCRPDIVTYNTLLDGLCKNGRVKDAYRLWRGMKKMNPDLSPNVVTYTTMIRGFCKRQRLDEALKFLHEMGRCGAMPNEITYNIIIQALCDADKLDETGKIVEEMIRGGFKPDACTFNILMNAQCKVGKLEEAVVTFDRMAELGVVANSATYSILIKSLCSRGNYEKAVYLFDNLLQKGILLKAGDCTPLVAAYNPMLEFLCEHGKTVKAEKFLRQSSMQGTQDPVSFKTVILGHCKEGAPNAGFEILKQMLWRNYSPDIDTYSALMQSFLKTGQLEDAKSIFEEMLKSGLMPMASTFHILIDSLCSYGKVQDASRIMKTMLEKDVRQNVDISTKVLSRLLCQGLDEEGFELLDLLYHKGFLPDMEKLMDDLCQEKKILEAQRLNYFVLEKDCYLDIAYYNTVLNGLCTSGKAMDAFSFFQRMTEKGKNPDLTCCQMLTNLLQKEGKLEQAAYVSSRLMRSSREVSKAQR
ncbi:hypothetical protein SUGI_1196100 [Cryptomeria japonica]|nr:hypothetical protein SUGI_1196100 [Cryptomeria japonica]